MSYDEAWYGEIARNLIISKNPFRLSFGGHIFTDHPPLGYLLMTLPMAILGSTEFSVRLVSALMGAGTILIVYLLGKKLDGRTTGLSASAILLSSLWFMFRARSGNLDVPLIFWEVLTVYFLISKGKKWLYFATVSFAALILTKALVGFGLLPLIFFILWFRRKELSKNTLVKAFFLWGVIVFPWYLVNYLNQSNFLFHHFIEIGIRGGSQFTLQSLLSNLLYLAIGIGKWYKIFLATLFLSVFTFIKQKKQRFNIGLLGFWLLGFVLILFSTKTEIWHLLPLYPVIALVIPLVLLNTLLLIVPRLTWLRTLFILGCFGLAIYQFHQFANLIYFNEPVYSAEKDIAVKARVYKKLHLMDTFYPAAVFYSQQNVDPLHWDESAYEKMIEILSFKEGDVFIINEILKKQLEKDQVVFIILDKNDHYYLISHK